MGYFKEIIVNIYRKTTQYLRQFLRFLGTPFLQKELMFFVRIIIIILMISVVTLIHDGRAVQNIRIQVNPLNQGAQINPMLAGFSSDPELYNKPELQNSLNENPGDSLRIFAPYNPGARALVKIVDGKYVILDSDNVTYTPGQTYHMELNVNGSLIRAYIDDQLIFSVNDSGLSQGDIGLLTADNQKQDAESQYCFEQ